MALRHGSERSTTYPFGFVKRLEFIQVIVHMSSGVVDGIDFDGGCTGCKACMKSLSGTTLCAKPCSGTDCQQATSVYVVYKGSDKYGVALTSTQYLFSSIREFSLDGLYVLLHPWYR